MSAEEEVMSKVVLVNLPTLSWGTHYWKLNWITFSTTHIF